MENGYIYLIGGSKDTRCVFEIPQVLFEFESERPNGNSATKQSPNYHSSDLDKVGQIAEQALSFDWFFWNYGTVNERLFLSTNCHLVVQTQKLKCKWHLKHTERTPRSNFFHFHSVFDQESPQINIFVNFSGIGAPLPVWEILDPPLYLPWLQLHFAGFAISVSWSLYNWLFFAKAKQNKRCWQKWHHRVLVIM